MNTPEELVLQEVDAAIASLERRTRKMKRVRYALRIGVMLLSGVSTVLLGLDVDRIGYAQWSRNIALTIGALVTFLAGVATFWDVDRYWLANKARLARLRQLRRQCQFAIAGARGPLSAEDIQVYRKALLSIENQEADYWEQAAVDVAHHLGSNRAVGSATPAQ